MTIKTEDGRSMVVVTKRTGPVLRRAPLEAKKVKRRLVGVKASSLPSAIQRSLTALSLPQIASWNVEPGVDASGESALWAWGTVVSNKVDPQELIRIREVAHAEIAKTTKKDVPWVYIRFRDAIKG